LKGLWNNQLFPDKWFCTWCNRPFCKKILFPRVRANLAIRCHFT